MRSQPSLTLKPLHPHQAWYYSGEGSLRNGNYVLAERLDIDEQPGPDVLDLSEVSLRV